MQFTKQTSIAIIGVSSNPEKYGHKIFRDLIKADYKVVGINPKDGHILDQTIYPSLKDLPQIPELVITVVPPQITEQVVDACHELGIENVWMQPGSESKQALEKAQSYQINATSNACFMLDQKLW
jgi:uncharacterized protein